jgi:hypothetical protein
MKVLRAQRTRPCPKCSAEAPGRRVNARMAYACLFCGARFWAPAVVIEVSGRTVSEKVRPLRRGRGLT